jgi:hypothetical protein
VFYIRVLCLGHGFDRQRVHITASLARYNPAMASPGQLPPGWIAEWSVIERYRALSTLAFTGMRLISATSSLVGINFWFEFYL